MVHFAKHGFQATGEDISQQGLAKAQRRATREEVAIRTIRADLADFRSTNSTMSSIRAAA